MTKISKDDMRLVETDTFEYELNVEAQLTYSLTASRSIL